MTPIPFEGTSPTAPAPPVPALAAAAVVNIVPLAQPVVSYPPRLLLGGASSRGRVRERNEDRFLTQHWNWNDAEGIHEVALVVADGMGGYQAGDGASSSTAPARWRTSSTPSSRQRRAAGRPTALPSRPALHQAILEANRVVYQRANTEARCMEMGATAALVVIWDGRACFGHVGDCRVYLHRGSDLKQPTEDHTLVAKMVALGKLTPEQAATREARNEVTQAIGKRPTIEPSRAEQALQQGDFLLVACDGLAAHVENQTIHQVLSRPAVPVQHLASQLVNMADAGGGTDNCTVVVAHFS